MNSLRWLRNSLCLAALGILPWQPLLATTTIHNNGFTASNQPLPDRPNYGSSVAAAGANWSVSPGETGITGTPGIVLTWDGEGGGGNSGANGGLDTYIAWNGRGNVVQLDSSGPGGTPHFFIGFSPAGGSAVKIVSFDLDAWAGWPAGGNMSVDWSIRDSTKTGDILASGTWTRTTGGRDVIAPDFTGNPGQTLVLQFTRTAGNGDYLAMDNLTFDEISQAAAIVSFTSPVEVIDGMPIALTWALANPANAASLTISDGVTTTDVLPFTSMEDGIGFFEVEPVDTTTYTLTLNGTATRQVTVLAAKAVSLTSNATVATAPGYQVTLNWLAQAVAFTEVTISDGITQHDVTSLTDEFGSGEAVFTVPSASTIFVLQVNGSPSTVSRRVLRQQANSADFSLESDTVPVGGPVTIHWANAAAGPTDWIGIYKAGDIPQLQVSTQWNYLNGTRTAGGSVPAGSMSFTLPAGDYYACLLLNDGYALAQGPLMFSVVEPPPMPEVIRVVSVVRAGNQFTIEWESQPGQVYDVRASGGLEGDPLVDWTLVADDLPADEDGINRYTEDLGATPPAKRFYRIYSAPAP